MAPLCRVLTLFRKIDRKCTTYELFKEAMEWKFRSEEEKKDGSAARLAILYVKPVQNKNAELFVQIVSISRH